MRSADGARLSPAARRTLDALCRTIVPAAYAPDWAAGRPFDLAAAVEQRLDVGDPSLLRRVDAALRLLEHRAAAVLSGRLRRFSELDDGGRARVLHSWETSALPLRRAVFQALRRLVLATCYTRPEALTAIGYLGPYHLRRPVYAWEGPLSGEPDEDEPVARQAGAARPASGEDEPVARQAGAARAASGEDAGVDVGRAEPRAPNVAGVAGSGPVAATALPPGVASVRTLPAGAVLGADVCVIGTGAGGAVAAVRLAEAGLDVIVLEEGDYCPPSERDEDEGRMTARLYADGAARFTDDYAMLLLQGRGIGGGSTVNWMITLRPSQRVMAQWSRGFGASTLGEDVLVPELARIEEEIHARPVPDDAHAPSNRIILDGAAKLGWRAAAARINARGCLRTGFCGLGCRYGAKQDVGEVYIRRAVEAGARVRTDARAESIRRGAHGGWSVEVTALGLVAAERPATNAVREGGHRSYAGSLFQPRESPRLTIRADTIVVAAGAVGTPALLQRSALGGQAVGRHLRLHPTTAVVGLYDRVMYGAAGIPQSAVCTEFMDRHDGYGFWIECPPVLPALAAASLPGFGATHRDRMREFPRLGTLIALVRDGAGGDRSQGRVSVARDGRIRIRYRMREPEWRTLDEAVRAAARLHLAAGAREAVSLHTDAVPMRSEAEVAAAMLRRGANRLALFSAHVNGTCRMSGSVALGPCTPEGELRGAPGVYVADGSLFPTAPGVNPQATIMALASLVARGIAARHRPSG